MGFDALLKDVGHFGLYQKATVLLVSLMILISTTHLYIQVFSAGKSDHWCKSWTNEGCPTGSLDVDVSSCEDLKKSFSIPIKPIEDNTTHYEQCTKYNVSGIDIQTAMDLGDDVTKLEVIPCDQGWEYDRSLFPSTIIHDVSTPSSFKILNNSCTDSYLGPAVKYSLHATVINF